MKKTGNGAAAKRERVPQAERRRVTRGKLLDATIDSLVDLAKRAPATGGGLAIERVDTRRKLSEIDASTSLTDMPVLVADENSTMPS